MSYFPDLTPHSYTPTDGLTLLNVGWLDQAYPFAQGETSPEFQDSLRQMCEHPVHLHHGYHTCQFCPADVRAEYWRIGNGQIRVKGHDGVWYAAPTMIYHYVVCHRYAPPAEFVKAVEQQ